MLTRAWLAQTKRKTYSATVAYILTSFAFFKNIYHQSSIQAATSVLWIGQFHFWISAVALERINMRWYLRKMDVQYKFSLIHTILNTFANLTKHVLRVVTAECSYVASNKSRWKLIPHRAVERWIDWAFHESHWQQITCDSFYECDHKPLMHW